VVQAGVALCRGPDPAVSLMEPSRARTMDERARRARERAQAVADQLRSKSDHGSLASDVPR
jgi:hypothetical protein